MTTYMDAHNLLVCECCALMAENGDESACRHYFNHTENDHPEGTGVDYSYVLTTPDGDTEWSKWTCDTCAGERLPGAVRFTYEYVAILAEVTLR